MKDETTHPTQSVNQQRRRLLQGTALVGAATVTPAVFGKAMASNSKTVVSGKLLSKIYDPMNTLVLQNHSDKAVVIDEITQSAMMFDGRVVDCNTACLNSPITIAANQEIRIQFDRREQDAFTRNIEDYRRVQSQVARLNDGTCIIPFTAKVEGNVATVA